MATGDRRDPYGQYNFLVEIDGVTRAGFTECSGLTNEQDIMEYREGGDLSATVRKSPGLVKYSNIALKWGVSDDTELWLWRKTTIDGVTERKSGAVILLNEAREVAARWNFHDGWVCKWDGPALNSTTSEVAIISIEICHEGIELV